MDDASRTRLSKFLSYVLRHEPHAISIELDQNGWVAIDRLLAACHESGRTITREMLEEVVRTNPKQRFAISDDGLRIRASQGHSLEIELGYSPSVPPELLFHGTVQQALTQIRSHGLAKMSRHHVHLSVDLDTAQRVGERRGKPVILRILAGKMHRDGHQFFLSANGVWLTERVPAEYIEFPEAS